MTTNNPHEQILQLLITGGFLNPDKLQQARDIIAGCAPSPGDNQSLEEAAKKYAKKHCKGCNGSVKNYPCLCDLLEAAYMEGALRERADESQMKRLYDWIMDENRKGATTFFTSGWLRNVAKEIEFRINEVKQVTNDMNTLAKMQSESMGWLVEKEKQLKALPDELRNANPWNQTKPLQYGAWNECVVKLQELLNQSK